MTVLRQLSLSAGEIAPSLYSRVDTSRYQAGLRTCRNFLIKNSGGADNRPGTEFVGEVKDSSKKVRLIPFIFNSSQTHVLEFGNLYMRVINDGEHVKESPKTITAVSQGATTVITSAAHGYANGDEVFIDGISNTNSLAHELDFRTFKVANVTTNTFEVKNMDGTALDSSAYSTYGSGGIAERIYTIVTTYLEADLSTLQYVQSADVITISHPNYPPREVTRSALTSWAISTITFGPSVTKPAGLSNNRGAFDIVGDPDLQWVVTAINSTTGEESLPSDSSYLIFQDARAASIISAGTSGGAGNITLNGTNPPISGGVATFNQPLQITLTPAAAGDSYATTFFSIVGLDAYGSPQSETVTGPRNRETVSTVKYFTKVSSVYAPVAIVSGGINVGNSRPDVYPVTLSWTGVTGTTYRIYKAISGIYGLIGELTADDATPQFDDVDITPDYTNTPPIDRQPFATSNNPSAVTYFQQRLLFADSNNDPETVWASQTGRFHNFSSRRPIQDDDAITFSLAGRQVNRVKHLLDLGQLVMLTSSGEWVIQGDSNGVFTPSGINPKQHSYHGSADVSPIVIGKSAIFVQARGSIIRDLGFDFNVDGYRGNDLTIFSNHLVRGYTITDWTYQQIPNSIVWAVRSDGTLLGLTYIKEQEIVGWHRHDFDGEVENVCSIPEGTEDALYLTIKRTVGSATKRYIERMYTRQISAIEDAVFLDSAHSYDGRNTSSTTMTLSGGTLWSSDETLTLTASASTFFASDIGDQIFLDDADGSQIRFTVNAYTSSTVVTGKPNRTVPATLQGVSTTDWAKAVSTARALWHLEGKEVSVFADGFVAANPNNSAYATVTVSGGMVALDKCYSLIHVGLPITADLQTLDVDTIQSETLADKQKIIQRVSMTVEASRGIWVGGKPPPDEETDFLGGLTEMKTRNSEGYDDPIDLKTSVLSINIQSQWNSNGRVFIRQTDPVPLSVLSVMPAGEFPIRNRTGAF